MTSGYTGKLPRKLAVRNLVTKSIESSVLSVEIYNKPTLKFRTAAFTSLMIIAWTSALHSVFERDGISYYYKKKNGRFERVDGGKRTWDLSTCLKKYSGNSINYGVISNLQLFIKLRNKIEHRQMSTLDSYIASECQSLLLNLKALLKAEFEIELLGDIGLYVPISVFSTSRSIPQTTEEKAIIQFIDKFRSSLNDSVWDDSKYAFRAFLIPKVGNHKNSSDVTIEFLKLGSLAPDKREKATKMITLIRDRQMPFREDLLKPGGVVTRVREHYPEFHMTKFVNAWKKLGVRPATGAEDPSKTDKHYCYYDPVDKDYRYEPAFADKICKMIGGGETFQAGAP